jgi:hypothetical protein
MRAKALSTLLLAVIFLAGCTKSPILDTPIPANSSSISKPTQDSHVGISMELDLSELNQKLQENVGTTLEHRAGVSVKVRFHKVIISKAEKAAIKTWHETKAAASEVRRRAGVVACNRKIRSSKRQECRHKRNNNHTARMNGYNATKAHRIEANLRKEVKGFELVPTAGQDNYVIAQTRLDGLSVSSLNGKLIVNTKVHSKIRLNIENPFDHSKEIKGLVQKRIDIQVGLSANIEFTKDGKIKLTNKKTAFSPRFSFSGVLSPLQSLANKMNNKISDKIKSAVDKQIAKIEFKKIVDEKLTSLTKTINQTTFEDNIWLIPNISKIHFKTTKASALNSSKLGVNLGLTFKPEVIYSENKPDVIDKISYDVALTNDQSKNQIDLNSTALIDISDVSPLLSSKVKEAMNEWIKKNESDKAVKKKWFDINKVNLFTSQGKILIVLYTKKPVSGTIILTALPVIENNGHSLRLTNASLYAGTKAAVSDETSWLLQLPFTSILKDKLSINLKSPLDKGLAKINKEGIPISKTEKISFKDESFSLRRLDVSNGNLLIEVSLKSNVVIEPRNTEEL